MKRAALVVLALGLLVFPATLTSCESTGPHVMMYFHAPDESPAPADWLFMLDSNVTANLTAFLLADRVDGLHELEVLDLTIAYRSVLGANASAVLEVEGGGPGAPGPDVSLWGPDPERRDFTSQDCTFNVRSWALRMRRTEPLVLARVRVANDTVELAWNATLGPARIDQHATLVLPGNVTALRELERADVRLVINNTGGLDAVDQVMDVRYGGRNVATTAVPLVPSMGEHILELTLEPVLGEDVLEVHVVQGPGAPYRLGLLQVPVVADSRLSVVAVAVTPTTVEEGKAVTITATVTNRGNLTASGKGVQFLVDGAVVTNATIQSLTPGATTKVSATWTATAPGTHAVSARVAGRELDARVESVSVTAQAPGPGALLVAVAVAIAVLTRAARR